MFLQILIVALALSLKTAQCSSLSEEEWPSREELVAGQLAKLANELEEVAYLGEDMIYELKNRDSQGPKIELRKLAAEIAEFQNDILKLDEAEKEEAKEFAMEMLNNFAKSFYEIEEQDSGKALEIRLTQVQISYGTFWKDELDLEQLEKEGFCIFPRHKKQEALKRRKSLPELVTNTENCAEIYRHLSEMYEARNEMVVSNAVLYGPTGGQCKRPFWYQILIPFAYKSWKEQLNHEQFTDFFEHMKFHLQRWGTKHEPIKKELKRVCDVLCFCQKDVLDIMGIIQKKLDNFSDAEYGRVHKNVVDNLNSLRKLMKS